mgnify:CR=1 FL=1
MASGKNHPGVGYFGYKSTGRSKGKAHPKGLGGGLEGVEVYNKGATDSRKMPTSGANATPKGVVRGDGTESLASKPNVKRGGERAAPHGGPPKWPAGVARGSGLSANRKDPAKPSSKDSD